MALEQPKHVKAMSSHEFQWRNCDQALAQLRISIEAVNERIHGYQIELDHIKSQREQAVQTRKDLLAQLEAARAGVELAELELTIAAGSDAEPEKLQAVEAAKDTSSQIEGELASLNAEVIHIRSAQWEKRESELTQELEIAGKEQGHNFEKEKQLQSIRGREFTSHGEEIKAALLSEIDQSLQAVEEAQNTLQEAQTLKGLIQDSICEQLSAWPALALDVETAHGKYTPSATIRILSKWLDLVLDIEEHVSELPVEALSLLSIDNVPHGSIRRYGTRKVQKSLQFGECDTDLYTFNQYMLRLQALAQDEHAKRKQAEVRLAHVRHEL